MSEEKMEKINIKEISKEILKAEHIEDAEQFEYILSEASAVQALDYFNIEFEDSTLTVPNDLDIEDALKTVNDYFEAIEESDVIENNTRAQEYNEHTKPHRGADDGTFDYAGTFVISILEIIKAIREQSSSQSLISQSLAYEYNIQAKFIRNLARYFNEQFRGENEQDLNEYEYALEAYETLTAAIQTREEYKQFEFATARETYEETIKVIEESSLIDLFIERFEGR